MAGLYARTVGRGKAPSRPGRTNPMTGPDFRLPPTSPALLDETTKP